MSKGHAKSGARAETEHRPRANHLIPEAIARAGPRIVRRRKGERSLWFQSFALLLISGTFLVLAGWFTERVAVLLLGKSVQAVVAFHSSTHSRKAGTTWTLHYRYPTDGGQWVKDEQSVSGTTWKVSAGQTVPVKVLRFWGMETSCVVRSPMDYADTLACALFLAALSGFGTWSSGRELLVTRPRRKALVRDGVAVEGTITEKLPGRNSRVPWRLKYTFRGPADVEWTRVDEVRERLYDSLAVGQRVIVLYDSRDPARAGLYEMQGFDVL